MLSREERILEELFGATGAALTAGKSLGDFVLVREIGRGGMGIVYEAEQRGLGRRVALKVLPAGAALDDRLALRFLREARAAARLCHPGIVPVYASGQAEGVLYYAMELIEGQTLEARIAEGALDPHEAARIAHDVALALEHAHGAGFVHRDVKPGNVLLSRDGATRLADFGLALEASAASVTMSRFVLGTPAFVAPEQIRGERADPRSDVYALGAVLYAMLAGRPPFQEDAPALVLARALAERPPALHTLRPGLPQALVATCERAMAKEPAERYPSAATLAADLAAFMSGAAHGLSARARGHRQLWVWSGAAALAIAAIGYSSVTRRETPSPAAHPLPALRPLVETVGRKTSPTLSPDGRWLAWSSDVAGEWDLYLADLDSGQVENVTANPHSADRSPVFDRAGRRLAYTSGLGPRESISLLDLRTRRSTDLAVYPGAADLSWSADGRELVFSDRGTDEPTLCAVPPKLFAVDVATGKVRALTGVYGSQAETSATAAAIVFVHQGGGRTDLWRMPQTGGTAQRITDDEALEWSPVWSQSGREIYFGAERDGVGRLLAVPVDAASSVRPRLLTDAIFPVPFYLARAAERETLALVPIRHDGRLYRVGLASGMSALPTPFLASDHPSVSPDGTRVVLTAVTSQEDLAIGAFDGSRPRRITDDSFRDREASWSPDGAEIAFSSDRSGKLEIWTVRADGTDLRQRTTAPGDAARPVWTPDGASLVYTVRGHGAFIDAQALPLAEGAAFEPCSWSPDGTLLAGSARGTVFLYIPAASTYRRLGAAAACPVWLDERRLVYVAGRHEIRTLDVVSGEESLLQSFAPALLSESLAVDRDRASLIVSLSSSPDVIWGLGYAAGPEDLARLSRHE